MWFLNAAAISAISGLILAVSVLVVVIAALRTKPDGREHTLQILKILVRWRDEWPADRRRKGRGVAR